MFPLHYIAEVLHAWVYDTWLIIHVKSFPLWHTVEPQYNCYWRRTDGRQPR